MIDDYFHARRQFVRPSGQPVGLSNTAVPGLSPALTNTWSLNPRVQILGHACK